MHKNICCGLQNIADITKHWIDKGEQMEVIQKLISLHFVKTRYGVEFGRITTRERVCSVRSSTLHD
jgi:hypothetical protein